MKKIYLCFSAVIALLWPLAASAAPADFAEATRLFQKGDFPGAATVYQELLGQQGASAPVLFNLGNCEQRLGNNGRAILYYERAKLLTPRNPDLLANLALARKATATFEEAGKYPRADAFIAYLSPNEWSWLTAGAALALGALALLRGIVRPRARWQRQAVVVVAAAAGIVMIVGGLVIRQRWDESRRGVVLTAAAPVRLSPFAKADALGTPGAGRIVRITNSKDGFRYVEVPGADLRGWMADKDVAPIVPDGSRG